MAQTLTSLEALNNDIIIPGVVDWLVKEEPLLKRLNMKTMHGNSLKYNVSLTLTPVEWTTANQQLAEATGTHEQRSADIYTSISNTHTDKGEIKKNAIQNPETRDMELSAQAMAQEFGRVVITGRTTTVSKALEPKGLMRLIAEIESESTTDLDGVIITGNVGGGNNSQVIAQSATSAALTMQAVDTMIDLIKPGSPDVLLMSKFGRRKLNSLQRASGGGSGAGVILNKNEDFGIFMNTYDNIPILISEYIPDNIADATSTVVDISAINPATVRAAGVDNSIMFALQLAENKFTGLHAGEMTHERHTFSENFNSIINRLVWMYGFALFRKFSASCLVNFDPTS